MVDITINIPNVPGVPALPSYSPGSIVLMAFDILTSLFGFGGPEWGIFLDGAPALPEANSTLTFAYKRDWTISDYPVQDGAFETYDKVQVPFDVRVKIVSGSSGSERQELLDAVDDIGDSLDLFDIVTPEKVYSSMSVTHIDYDRSASTGVGMIQIELWFQEIRVTAAATFSNTASPTAAGQKGSGNVQPQSTSPNVEQNFNDGNWQVQ